MNSIIGAFKKLFRKILSILRERSFAIFALIFACVSDFDNDKVESSSSHLNYDSLSKLFIFLDICGCSAFCWLQKSLEEKADAMHQRVIEENVVLSANIDGNSSFCQTIRNVRRIYKNNLDLLRSNINNNNNNLNNSL